MQICRLRLLSRLQGFRFLGIAALTLSISLTACAHGGAGGVSGGQAASSLDEARERGRLRTRVAQLEASIAAMEAKLAALQAVSRSPRGASLVPMQPQPTLQVERWQPPAATSIGNIVGQGDRLRLSRVHVSEDSGR